VAALLGKSAVKRFLPVAALTALLASGAARAGDHGVKAELEAFVPPGHPLQAYLHVTNTSGRNICFFIDVRFLSWKESLLGLDYVAIPDVPLDRSDVHVAWGNGRTEIFPVSYDFLDPEHAGRVAKLTYNLEAYDCVALLSHPDGDTPALFKRAVNWSPDALKTPAPSPP
jgi:hypothetical protein